MRTQVISEEISTSVTSLLKYQTQGMKLPGNFFNLTGNF